MADGLKRGSTHYRHSQIQTTTWVLNKVLLGHGHTHSVTYFLVSLRLLLRYSSRVELLRWRPRGLQRLRDLHRKSPQPLVHTVAGLAKSL